MTMNVDDVHDYVYFIWSLTEHQYVRIKVKLLQVGQQSYHQPNVVPVAN